MNLLREAIVYLIGALPRQPLRTSLVKYVYLADLIGVSSYGVRVTDLEWKFHNHGPYAREVVEAAQALDEERIVAESWGTTYHGDRFYAYGRGREWQDPDIPPKVRSILDDVVADFGSLNLDQLLECVYSMPPMTEAQRGAPLTIPAARDAFAEMGKRAAERARRCADDEDPAYELPDLAGAVALQTPALSRRFLDED